MRARGRARGFRAVPVIAFSFFIAIAGMGSASAAPNCFESISEANAQRLYDALVRAKPSDGCTLDEVRTETSYMRIVWKKEGELQEAILMVPTSCAKSPTARGQVLSTIVPSSVVDACPTAVSTLNALVASEAFGGLVADPKGSTVPVELPRHWKRLAVPIAAALVVLAMASGAFFVLRRRRALRASSGEPAAKPESDAPKPVTDAPKPPGDA